MGKVNGPLFSIGASGQLAKAMIFSQRKSGQMVRAYHKPSGAPTGAQLAQRALIAELTLAWQQLTPAEKAVYNDEAKQRHLCIW